VSIILHARIMDNYGVDVGQVGICDGEDGSHLDRQ
jgi:hypothetical protein